MLKNTAETRLEGLDRLPQAHSRTVRASHSSASIKSGLNEAHQIGTPITPITRSTHLRRPGSRPFSLGDRRYNGSDYGEVICTPSPWSQRLTYSASMSYNSHVGHHTANVPASSSPLTNGFSSSSSPAGQQMSSPPSSQSSWRPPITSYHDYSEIFEEPNAHFSEFIEAHPMPGIQSPMKSFEGYFPNATGTPVRARTTKQMRRRIRCSDHYPRRQEIESGSVNHEVPLREYSNYHISGASSKDHKRPSKNQESFQDHNTAKSHGPLDITQLPKQSGNRNAEIEETGQTQTQLPIPGQDEAGSGSVTVGEQNIIALFGGREAVADRSRPCVEDVPQTITIPLIDESRITNQESKMTKHADIPLESPAPERPLSSQSKERFSRILSIDEEHLLEPFSDAPQRSNRQDLERWPRKINQEQQRADSLAVDERTTELSIGELGADKPDGLIPGYKLSVTSHKASSTLYTNQERKRAADDIYGLGAQSLTANSRHSIQGTEFTDPKFRRRETLISMSKTEKVIPSREWIRRSSLRRETSATGNTIRKPIFRLTGKTKGSLINDDLTVSHEAPQISLKPPSPTFGRGEIHSYFSEDSSLVQGGTRKRLSRLKSLTAKAGSALDTMGLDRKASTKTKKLTKRDNRGSKEERHFSSDRGRSDGMSVLKHAGSRLQKQIRHLWNTGRKKLRTLNRK